jgi:4a-hydroxytetrahydrobiopterin dehydratase
MATNVPTGWTQASNALTHTIKRADFVDVLALVLQIGKLAEVADHHPDIDIRYRTVHLSLSSHSAGHTVTERDFALAQKINELTEDEIRLTRDELRSRFGR